jgi:hypothetical protein
VDILKKAITFSCPTVAIIIVLGLVGCSGISSTSASMATQESRMSGGFSFSVSVSNTHPRLGEKVIINTELQNVYNTGVVLQNLAGETTIQIINEGGQVVWGIVRGRSGTTLSVPITIGFQVGGDNTWTVAKDPNYAIPVDAGTYTLNVSDTGFHNPALNMDTPFPVTPIQITVTK